VAHDNVRSRRVTTGSVLRVAVVSDVRGSRVRAHIPNTQTNVRIISTVRAISTRMDQDATATAIQTTKHLGAT